MQRFKLSIPTFILISIITNLCGATLAQSGRGRPTVPTRRNAPEPPQPVAVPAAAAIIKQEQAGALSRFALKNGITVIINEQYATPIVASVAYFKADASSATEDASVALLAERMMFRGTKSRPAGRAETDARSLGASFGSESLIEGAAYYFVSPPEKLKDALALQADMLQNPSFDPAEMRREAALLIEEEKGRNLRVNYSSSQLLENNFDGEALMRARMNGDALRSITHEQLVEFYQKQYRPKNLVIAVAGAAPLHSTLVQIQQLYGGFGVVDDDKPAASAGKPVPASPRANQPGKPNATEQASKPPDNQSAKPAAQPESKTESGNLDKPTSQVAPAAEQSPPARQLSYAATRQDISQAAIGIDFTSSTVEPKDRYALEVLAAILGRGRTSRLNRLLVDAQLAASHVESSFHTSGKGGMLSILLHTPSGSVDRAESALFREVDRLRRELMAEGELERAKAALEKRFVDAHGQYLSRAFALARAESLEGGFRAWIDYRNRIRAVTAEEVQRAAAKYLTLENTIVHERLPASSEPRNFDSASFAQTVRSWAAGLAQPVDPKSVRAAEADPAITAIAQGAERDANQSAILESVQPLAIKDFSTLNGPRAFVREDHSQPAVTIAVLFQGGRILEDEMTSGITELLLRSILYGTPRRAGIDVANELDQLGADVRIVVEPDFFGFTLSVLSRNADRALKILRDATEEPALRDEDVERARLAHIGAIREEKDSISAHSRRLLYQAMFTGHAYALPRHGSEEVVSKLTSKQLRDWYTQSVKRQLPIAIIVGDTNGSALVSSQLAEGFRRRDVDKDLQVKVPQPVKPSDKSEQRRRELSSVSLGFAGPKAESADRVIIELITAAMNGRGGRLLEEMRDKQAVALDAAMDSEALFLAGTIYAQAISLPANEQRARTALSAEFERIAREGLSAGEIAAARSLALTLRLAGLQSQSRRAIEYARAVIYKREAASVDSLGEQMATVTADDVKRVASVYFKPSLASVGIARGSAQ